jgi:hypothetical protein
VHKGSTQTNKRLKLGFNIKGAKKPSVPWSGAPDCPVCHRTVYGAPGPYKVQTATLEFQPARSAIIHRTIRCTSGATTTSRNGRLQKLKIQRNSARQSRAPVRGAPDTEQCMSGTASNCPVPLEDKASNGQKLLNPNGWVMWLAHRTVSGAPIDSSLPQRSFGG